VYRRKFESHAVEFLRDNDMARDFYSQVPFASGSARHVMCVLVHAAAAAVTHDAVPSALPCFQYDTVQNDENLMQLLFGFFKYFATEFNHLSGVAAIHKDGKLDKSYWPRCVLLVNRYCGPVHFFARGPLQPTIWRVWCDGSDRWCGEPVCWIHLSWTVTSVRRPGFFDLLGRVWLCGPLLLRGDTLRGCCTGTVPQVLCCLQWVSVLS